MCIKDCEYKCSSLSYKHRKKYKIGTKSNYFMKRVLEIGTVGLYIFQRLAVNHFEKVEGKWSIMEIINTKKNYDCRRLWGPFKARVGV